MLVHVRACVYVLRVYKEGEGGRENSAREEFTLRIKESSAGSHPRQKSPNEIFLIRSQLARLSRSLSLSHLSFTFFFAGGNSKLRPKYSRNVACIRDNQILKLIITSYLIYFREEKLTLLIERL